MKRTGFIYTPRNMYQVATDDQREAGDRVDFAHVFTPRNSDQENVIDDCLMRLRRGENFILEAPTGWGKTYVCVAIIAAMGRRALVIVTKDDIVKQWANAVNTIIKDCRIGYWRGDTVPKRDDQIVIGLVQSLRKGQERYPAELFKGFGFVVVDEAHRMGADEFSQSMWHFPAKLRLGLTATPDRKDGKEMVFKGHIGPVQVKAKMDVLSFGVLAVATSWKVPYINMKGEYVPYPHKPGRVTGLLKFLQKNPDRNRLIKQFTEKSRAKGRRVVIFSDGIKHLKILSEMFDKDDVGWYIGLSNKVYKGSDLEREKQRESDKLKPIVMATYQMAAEATDVPVWDTCVLASPQK